MFAEISGPKRMNEEGRKTGEKADGSDSCFPAFLIVLGILSGQFH
jgi:hypothetical protein